MTIKALRQRPANEGVHMDEKFESDDLTIEKLFDDFYVVPDYQREYVWESGEVEKLLTDMLQEFDGAAGDYRPEYFVGTIVARTGADQRTFELIDGQQRITTLFVIFCVIRDILAAAGQTAEGVAAQLRGPQHDPKGKTTYHFRVELQYEDSQNTLRQLAAPRDDVPITTIPAETRSARNLVSAYMDTSIFIASEFGGDPKRVLEFWAYVSQRVKLIRIRTSTVSHALWIFETINKRGRDLDGMDLLKNLLFASASERDFARLKVRWKSLADTLFALGESPMRFMRYFLLANYATDKLKADDVYGWLTDPKNPERPDLSTDPVQFASELLEAASAYRNFVGGRFTDGTESTALRNVWHMAHAARQHFVLMLAVQNSPREAQAKLAEEIERLYFVYLITGQRSNRFESDFVDWASQLRRLSTLEDISGFVEREIVPRRHALARQFTFSFTAIREGELPRYRLKYVLAKVAYALDSEANGDQSMDPLAPYLARNVEIEHILAQGASAEIRDAFGTAEAVARAVPSLGNLTLLEKPLNGAAGAAPLAEKLETYRKSKFLLTSGLAQDHSVGEETAADRALNRVKSFDTWTPGDIRARSENLLELAQDIWDVPAYDDDPS